MLGERSEVVATSQAAGQTVSRAYHVGGDSCLLSHCPYQKQRKRTTAARQLPPDLCWALLTGCHAATGRGCSPPTYPPTSPGARTRRPYPFHCALFSPKALIGRVAHSREKQSARVCEGRIRRMSRKLAPDESK